MADEKVPKKAAPEKQPDAAPPEQPADQPTAAPAEAAPEPVQADFGGADSPAEEDQATLRVTGPVDVHRVQVGDDENAYVVTREGTQVPASVADALVDQASSVGVNVEKVED